MDKNASLQGLRGYAALVVFFSHILGMVLKNNPYSKTFLHFFWDGSISVYIFFVLSGYFTANYFLSKNYISYGKFIINRFIKLYPFYFFSLIIAFVLCISKVPFDENNFTLWGGGFWNTEDTLFILLKDFIKNVCLFGDFNKFNPPIWTMFIEVKSTVIFPLVLLAIKDKTILDRNCLLFAVCFISICIGFSFLIYFYFGTFLYVNQKFISKLVNKNISSKLIFCFISFLMLNINNNQIYWRDSNGIIISLGVALLVAVLLENDTFVFNNPVFVFIGNISYEFYLIHFIVLLSFRSLKGFFPSNIIYIITTLFVCIVLSYFFSKINKKIILLLKEKFEFICGHD